MATRHAIALLHQHRRPLLSSRLAMHALHDEECRRGRAVCQRQVLPAQKKCGHRDQRGFAACTGSCRGCAAGREPRIAQAARGKGEGARRAASEGAKAGARVSSRRPPPPQPPRRKARTPCANLPRRARPPGCKGRDWDQFHLSTSAWRSSADWRVGECFSGRACGRGRGLPNWEEKAQRSAIACGRAALPHPARG